MPGEPSWTFHPEHGATSILPTVSAPEPELALPTKELQLEALYRAVKPGTATQPETIRRERLLNGGRSGSTREVETLVPAAVGACKDTGGSCASGEDEAVPPRSARETPEETIARFIALQSDIEQIRQEAKINSKLRPVLGITQQEEGQRTGTTAAVAQDMEDEDEEDEEDDDDGDDADDEDEHDDDEDEDTSSVDDSEDGWLPPEKALRLAELEEMVAQIEEQHAKQRASKREQLRELKVYELRRRAKEADVSEAEVEAATDAADHRSALVELVLAREREVRVDPEYGEETAEDTVKRLREERDRAIAAATRSRTAKHRGWVCCANPTP
eukprot:COSAG05_NODE_165_length_15343_cov_194.625492_7_plen_330_part_00